MLKIITNNKDSIIHTINGQKYALLMFGCILGYALLKLAYRPLGDIFQTVFVLGSIPFIYINRDTFKTNKLVILLYTAIILQLFSWFNSIIQIPELSKNLPNISILSNLFLFVLISIWLKGSKLKCCIFLGAFIIGVILTFYIHSEIGFIKEILLGYQGRRIDFNVTNAQHTSLLAGSILLVLICIPFSINWRKDAEIKMRLSLMAIYSLLFSFSLFVIVTTQSRQVWLSLITVLFFLPIISIAVKNKSKSIRNTIAIYFVILFSVIAISHMSIINKRLSVENGVIEKVIGGEIHELPYSSIGVRIRLWHEGYLWFKQYPILGTGEESRNLVIKTSTVFPAQFKENFSHLHNSNVETLVSYGIVGMILLMFLFFYPVINLSRSKEQSNHFFKILSMSFLIYWLMVNNFESFYYMKSGQWTFNVFFGIFYTFQLTKEINNDEHN